MDTNTMTPEQEIKQLKAKLSALTTLADGLEEALDRTLQYSWDGPLADYAREPAAMSLITYRNYKKAEEWDKDNS